MTPPRAIREAERRHVTIAITDPEFAVMLVRHEWRAEEIEVKAVPVDVVVYCRWLEKKGTKTG